MATLFTTQPESEEIDSFIVETSDEPWDPEMAYFGEEEEIDVDAIYEQNQAEYEQLDNEVLIGQSNGQMLHWGDSALVRDEPPSELAIEAFRCYLKTCEHVLGKPQRTLMLSAESFSNRATYKRALSLALEALKASDLSAPFRKVGELIIRIVKDIFKRIKNQVDRIITLRRVITSKKKMDATEETARQSLGPIKLPEAVASRLYCETIKDKEYLPADILILFMQRVKQFDSESKTKGFLPGAASFISEATTEIQKLFDGKELTAEQANDIKKKMTEQAMTASGLGKYIQNGNVFICKDSSSGDKMNLQITAKVGSGYSHLFKTGENGSIEITRVNVPIPSSFKDTKFLRFNRRDTEMLDKLAVDIRKAIESYHQHILKVERSIDEFIRKSEGWRLTDEKSGKHHVWGVAQHVLKTVRDVIAKYSSIDLKETINVFSALSQWEAASSTKNKKD